MNVRSHKSSSAPFILFPLPSFHRPSPSPSPPLFTLLLRSSSFASLPLIFHLISAWLALLFPPHCSFTLCSLPPFPLYNSPCCFSLSLLCHSPARSLIDSGGDVTGMPSGSSLFCRRAAGVRVERQFTSISLSLCERQDRVARGRRRR